VKRDGSGAKTELITFTGDTEAHFDAAGAIQYVYSHLSMGTPIARITRTDNISTSTEYQFHGLASSTLATVSDSGTINTSFRYSPWGAVLESTNAGGASNGTAAHRRRHNDKYVDEVSSLAYYGARYYDKTLLAWTQSDPLYLRVPDVAQMSSPRRASLYAYTLQNSMRYLDPDGLDAGNWGARNFLTTCGAGSVCAAGAAIEGEGRGGVDGETSTTGLRSMIGLGVAKQTKYCGNSTPGGCDSGFIVKQDQERYRIVDNPSPSFRGDENPVVFFQRLAMLCGRFCDKFAVAGDRVVRGTQAAITRVGNKISSAANSLGRAIDSYQRALSGIKHANFMRNAQRWSPSQIARAMRSNNQNIQEHTQYLLDPRSHVPNWETLSHYQQYGMMGHWLKEIHNFEAQNDILWMIQVLR
jgi:RHS repeat-associated protein